MQGGRRLAGTYPISGAKNAVLPLMVSALLKPHLVTLHNVPPNRDVAVLAALLKGLGVGLHWSKPRNSGTPRAYSFRLFQQQKVPDMRWIDGLHPLAELLAQRMLIPARAPNDQNSRCYNPHSRATRLVRPNRKVCSPTSRHRRRCFDAAAISPPAFMPVQPQSRRVENARKPRRSHDHCVGSRSHGRPRRLIHRQPGRVQYRPA